MKYRCKFAVRLPYFRLPTSIVKNSLQTILDLKERRMVRQLPYFGEASHPESTGPHDTPEGQVISEQSRATSGTCSNSDGDPNPSGQSHLWRQ